MRRINPATVIATIALVASLGGTAIAAGLANNSVKSRTIVNGQVKNQDLGNGSVTSPKIKNASITTDDVQDGSLTGQDVQDGSVSGQDVQDDSLTGNDVNESSLQGVMASRTRFVSAQANPVPGPSGGFPSQVQVSCAPSEKAIGGGAAWIIPNFQDGNQVTALHVTTTVSAPVPINPGIDGATGWQAAGRNLSGLSRALRVYAVCVPRTPGA
jgi:hypothetical protein